jgi:hypothetical protein
MHPYHISANIFDFIYFPFDLMFPTLTNLCPGVVISTSLSFVFILCILLYVFEQGNLIFLASSALQSIKHGHGHFVGVLVDRCTDLSTSVALYLLVIFMSSMSSTIYFVAQSLSLITHTCGTGDTVVFVFSFVFFVFLTPFVLILFIRAFSENKDEDYKLSTVDKVFFTIGRNHMFKNSKCFNNCVKVTSNSNNKNKILPQKNNNTNDSSKVKIGSKIKQYCQLFSAYMISQVGTIFTEVIVLLKVTFGLWDQTVVEHYNIKGKAIEFNSDTHDSVLTLTAKGSTLFWLTFSTPLVILNKIGEITSDPPINWAKQKELIFEDDFFHRFKQWIINIITLTFTMISVIFRTCSVYVALISWALIVEALNLIPDLVNLIKHRKQIIESIANSIEGRSNLNGENEDADDEDDLEKLASKKQRGY